MTHQDINVADYHEGDAIDLPIVVRDTSATAVDLTNAQIQWYLKENKLDSDAAALITKTTDVGGGIEITSATTGEAVIHIYTGDTAGLLDPGTGQTERGVFHHRCRVTDAAGNRSTIFHGSFTIYV